MTSAVVTLDNAGNVERTHSIDLAPPLGPNVGAPSTRTSDLERLIDLGYVVKRETALDGGRVLLVLEKP